MLFSLFFTILEAFYKILIEADALTDILYADMLVCAVNGSKLLFVKINERKSENRIGNVGKPSCICSRSKQEGRYDNVGEIIMQKSCHPLKAIAIEIGGTAIVTFYKLDFNAVFLADFLDFFNIKRKKKRAENQPF